MQSKLQLWMTKASVLRKLQGNDVLRRSLDKRHHLQGLAAFLTTGRRRHSGGPKRFWILVVVSLLPLL